MWTILIANCVLVIGLVSAFCTYLFKNRNSTMLGWLANLSMISILFLFADLISIFNNWVLGVIFGLVMMLIGLILFLGLSLSFIFLFANSFIVFRRESHSLSSSLTLIAGIGIILVDIFIFFNPISAPAPVKMFLTSFLTMIIFYVLLTVWNTMLSMILYHWYFPKRDKDYIIVLGAGLVDGYKVGKLLGNRINTAIDFYHRQLKETHKRAKLIFSGGQGSDEKLPEGEAMKQYAVAHGVPEADTLVEGRSVNTRQNMQFSEQIIEQDGGSARSKKIFVTNNYHTLRAGILAHQLKIAIYGLGAPTPFYFLPNAVIREYLALFVMHKRFHTIMIILMFLISLGIGISQVLIPVS
ncbi:YdcF family protein [Lentilactobacillus parafarraginis]|nr:YdcF family protein [Lentilactobacillus parafarraginis]